MEPKTDNPALEALSREVHIPVERLQSLYEHEHAALARDATIINFIPLLAARRLRRKLLHPH